MPLALAGSSFLFDWLAGDILIYQKHGNIMVRLLFWLVIILLLIKKGTPDASSGYQATLAASHWVDYSYPWDWMGCTYHKHLTTPQEINYVQSYHPVWPPYPKIIWQGVRRLCPNSSGVLLGRFLKEPFLHIGSLFFCALERTLIILRDSCACCEDEARCFLLARPLRRKE